ncbi:MAG: hypothetical protein ACYTF1_15005 [Planctomycetota bacterium]|jgi:hypothetical protein
MVTDTSEPQGELERLERFGTLVNRYAQSRSLGLLIPVAIILINMALLQWMDKLMAWKPEVWWILAVVLFEVLFSIGAVWLIFKLVKRYAMNFYRSDGVIELPRTGTPLIAVLIFLAVHTIPAALTMFEYISNRWGLSLILTVAGAFIIYIRNREKETPTCLVLGGLLLLEAVAVALGMPTPFHNGDWDYSFCWAYVILFASAAVVTAIAVHIYNRRIWRRIVRERPFHE